jgi:hypothetical protein
MHDRCPLDYCEATDATAEEAEAWMAAMEREHARYVANVFASGPPARPGALRSERTRRWVPEIYPTPRSLGLRKPDQAL